MRTHRITIGIAAAANSGSPTGTSTSGGSSHRSTGSGAERGGHGADG